MVWPLYSPRFKTSSQGRVSEDNDFHIRGFDDIASSYISRSRTFLGVSKGAVTSPGPFLGSQRGMKTHFPTSANPLPLALRSVKWVGLPREKRMITGRGALHTYVISWQRLRKQGGMRYNKMFSSSGKVLDKLVLLVKWLLHRLETVTQDQLIQE